MAVERGIDLLIVHHGLFWPGLQPITGPLYRALKLALEHNLALYSAHLPLDLHPTIGNNVLLAAALGFEKTEPFLELKGQPIGLQVEATLRRDELIAKLEESLGGPVRCVGTGPMETKAHRDCHRRRRRRNLRRGAGGDRHLHHGRSAALGGGRGGRTRHQSFPWRPLRDRDFRGQSARRRTLGEIRGAVGISRSSHRLMRDFSLGRFVMARVFSILPRGQRPVLEGLIDGSDLHLI